MPHPVGQRLPLGTGSVLDTGCEIADRPPLLAAEAQPFQLREPLPMDQPGVRGLIVIQNDSNNRREEILTQRISETGRPGRLSIANPVPIRIDLIIVPTPSRLWRSSHSFRLRPAC